MTAVHVYVAKMPAEFIFSPLSPYERDAEVNSVSNFEVKKQKYFVWKLLAYGIFDAFGSNIKNLKFTKDENGKWRTPAFFFSLSHSENYVAVALSRKKIGVDIQLIKNGISDKFVKKMLTTAEYEQYTALSNDEERTVCFFKKWAIKESAFKQSTLAVYSPKSIDTTVSSAYCEVINDGQDRYVLAVSSDNLDDITVHKNHILK